MVTTAAQLLDQAHVRALSLGRSLPPPWPATAPGQGQRDVKVERNRQGRGPMAWELYRAHEVAWPQLAAAARYALESVPAHVHVREEFGPVVEALERVERRIARSTTATTATGGRPVVPDAQLVQGARLLSAAGEALRVERSTASPVGADDIAARAAGLQVAAVVAAFARFTTAYAEQARVPGTAALVGPEAWRSLVGRLDDVLDATERTTRRTDLTTRPVPDSSEESLAGVLHRWRAAVDEVHAHRDEIGGVSGDDLRRTAEGLLAIHAAAAGAARAADHAGASGSVGAPGALEVQGGGGWQELARTHLEAARGWSREATVWSSWMQLPGRSAPTLKGATRDLVEALTDYTGRVQGDRTRPGDTTADTSALSHFTRTQVRRIAAEHVQAVTRVVQREAVLVPARRVVEAARSAAAGRRDAQPAVDPGPDRASTPFAAPARVVVRDQPRVSVALAEAARHGRWVNLTSTNGVAGALVQDTADAHQRSMAAAAAEVAVSQTPPPLGKAYERAGGLPGSEDGLDPEAARARRVSAAGFSRSTRQTLADSASGSGAHASPPLASRLDQELTKDPTRRR